MFGPRICSHVYLLFLLMAMWHYITTLSGGKRIILVTFSIKQTQMDSLDMTKMQKESEEVVYSRKELRAPICIYSFNNYISILSKVFAYVLF